MGRGEYGAFRRRSLIPPHHCMPSDRNVRLINLTSHPLDIGNGWDFARLESEGLARVESVMKMRERVLIDDGRHGPLAIPVLEIEEGDVTGLPDPCDGILYVVSGIVAARVVGRDDVVSPGRVDRDGDGKVTRAKALVRVTRHTN